MPDVPERLAGEALAWFQVTVTSDAASEGCPSQTAGLTVEHWRAGTAAGEDIVAGVMIRPPLSCVKQSATSGTMPAPGDGGGAE